MQKLNAIDAISPAWDHTRKLLLSPMRWQTLLKIGLVAAFAGAGGSGGSYNNFNGFNPGSTGNHPHWPSMHLPAIAAIATILVIVGIVVLVVAFFFFYLSSRLQFVLFDVVLRRNTIIGPIWSRYGAATWRWMGLRFLLVLIALILLLPILIPLVLAVAHALSHDPTAQPNFGTLLAGFFASFAAILLVALLSGVCGLLLHDFGLPSMAIEGTSLNETVSRIFRLVRAEPLDLLLYVVMKVVLRIAIAIGAGIAVLIGFFLLAIPFAIVGGILFAALHHAGSPAIVLMWAGIALLAAVFLVIMFAVGFMLSGIMGTFFQAYNLYFLGGRYPLLGEILEPTPIPPPVFDTPLWSPPPDPSPA